MSDNNQLFKTPGHFQKELDVDDNSHRAYMELIEKNQVYKKDSGKPDISMVPPELMEGAARAFMFGEEKYGRWNWKENEDNFELGRLVAPLFRHVLEFYWRENKADDSGLHHLDHAAACLAMLMHLVYNKKGKDDRCPTVK